jgi:hypothetical protein
MPTGYIYTGLPDRRSNNYAAEVRQMLEEGGDPKWKEGKVYSDEKCLQYTQKAIVKMVGAMYDKSPAISSLAAVEVANTIVSETASTEIRSMHDPVLCRPLFRQVTKVHNHAAIGEYQQAFEIVDGILLALSGEATNGTYMTSDIGIDLAGLMVATVAHVISAFAPLPDSDSPAGWSVDSVLSRLVSLRSPGDKTVTFERLDTLLKTLAEKRSSSSRVLILESSSVGIEDVGSMCSMQEFYEEREKFMKTWILGE